MVAALRPGFLKSSLRFAPGFRNPGARRSDQAQRLDVGFAEDDCRIRKDNAPQNFAVLRHIAVNLLGKEKSKKFGIKNKQFLAAMDDNYLAKVLELTL